MPQKDDAKAVIQDVNDISRLFIQIVKDLSSKGESLSISALSNGLNSYSEIKNLLNLATDHRETLAQPILEDEIEQLKTTIEEDDRERRKLANALYAAEHDLNTEKDFNKRQTLSFINLCEVLGNEETLETMAEFRDTVIDTAGENEREQALGKVRSLIMKLDVGSKGKTASKGSLFGKLLKPTVSNTLQQLKKASLKSLDQLGIIIGMDFSEKIDLLKEQVTSSDSVDYLISLKNGVMEIIEHYAEKTENDRNNVTGFMKEIGERIVSLEESLLASQENKGKELEVDMAFNEGISSELKTIGNTVKKSDEIKKLKSYVLDHIDRIDTEIETRREEYIVRIDSSSGDSEKLKSHFKSIIENLENKNKILEKQSSLDPLTGIYNRRIFTERLSDEFERFKRYDTPFSLLFFDVDHFKIVNDTYGHDAGDKVLRGIAASTGQILRKTDVLSRYGGEEFVVILFETTLNMAVQAAEKLRELIETAHFDYEGTAVPITISIGVTEVSSKDMYPEEVVSRSDKYLYRAKQAGRNMVMSDKDESDRK